MIRIVNMHKGKYKHNPDEILIKVDRSSILGNPFIMKNESERNKVCDLYDNYFYNKIDEQDEKFVDELDRIIDLADTNNIALGCWCIPKRCHAQTILNYVCDHL
jgi:hypothetical protein